jgi:hypothetical protein
MLNTTRERESRYLVYMSEELLLEAVDELLYPSLIPNLLYSSEKQE